MGKAPYKRPESYIDDPLDEEPETPESLEEDFQLAKACGDKPEDYPADPKFAEQYREWLKKNS